MRSIRDAHLLRSLAATLQPLLHHHPNWPRLEKLLNKGSNWLARMGLACLVTLDINTFELDSISTHGLGTLGILAPPPHSE